MNAYRMDRDRRWVWSLGVCSLTVSALAGCQAESSPGDDGSIAAASESLAIGSSGLRRLIARQVGGLDKLRVPRDNASIPLPPEDPARPGRYRTTEAKRYLGKMLFHDPVRTARINVNQNVNPPIRAGEPRDLPAGTAFGGTLPASDPSVATSQLGRTTSSATMWFVVTPYLKQCGPPAFSATLPPSVHAAWLDGSGA